MLWDKEFSLLNGFLKHHFSMETEGDAFESAGGLIYSSLGKMPGAGDVAFVDGLKLQVLNTIGGGIKKIRVIRVPKESDEHMAESPPH